MSNEIEKIISLLNRAGHPNTPENEARSCAVIAAKLFYKHKFKIVNESYQHLVQDTAETEYSNYNNTYDITDIPPPPQNDNDWKEVKTFKVDISKQSGTCKKCSKSYNRGEIIATSRNDGSTHYRCRHFWIEQRA